MTDIPILDMCAFERMKKEIRTSGIKWLVDLYIQEVPNYLANIRRALADNDKEALYLAAHKFKGGSANLGAKLVVTLCKQIEETSRNGSFEEMREQFSRLEDAVQKTTAELKIQKEQA